MLASEVISDVRLELLEPVAGFWSDAELLNWLNRAETDFANRVRGLEGKATLSTSAGQSTYPLPANWISAVAIFYNDVADDGTDDWKPLEPTDLQRLSRETPGFLSRTTSDQGTPTQYFIWDRELNLYQVPDTDGDANVLMFFKAKPVALTATSQTINVDDTMAHALRHYILWKAWSKEKEFQLASDQQALYFQAVRDGLRSVKLQALNKRHQIDVQANIPFRMGQ
jgi:hypothetical protein